MEKIRKLYLNYGNWNGKQIISQKWIEGSIKESSFKPRAKDRIELIKITLFPKFKVNFI